MDLGEVLVSALAYYCNVDHVRKPQLMERYKYSTSLKENLLKERKRLEARAAISAQVDKSDHY